MTRLSSGISSLWKGRDPTLKVRQQEGWPKYPPLASLRQRAGCQQNKKPLTGTRPHRCTLGSWDATVGLPGRVDAVWGGMLFINTESTNLSSPSFPFLFTSPLPYHPKSCYSISFLNSRLLLVVLSASSRLIVSKADISSMRVSDRFGLTFYDTCADSTLPPQIHTTAAEQAQGLCNQKKQNFSSFYMKISTVTFPLNTNYETSEFHSVRMCQSESVGTDPKGGQNSQFQSKTKMEIT